MECVCVHASVFNDTDTKRDVNIKPVDVDAIPVENAKPVENARPAENTKPVENARPVEKTRPVENTRPVLDVKPVVAETKQVSRDALAMFRITVRIFPVWY